MSSAINTLADCLLAVLLVATIASCVALSRRITRLKSDESAMRKTVGELMLATETAERAIAGLRTPSAIATAPWPIACEPRSATPPTSPTRSPPARR